MFPASITGEGKKASSPFLQKRTKKLFTTAPAFRDGPVLVMSSLAAPGRAVGDVGDCKASSPSLQLCNLCKQAKAFFYATKKQKLLLLRLHYDARRLQASAPANEPHAFMQAQ